MTAHIISFRKLQKTPWNKETKFPFMHTCNSLVIPDLGKANLFASDLENRFTPNTKEYNQNHINYIVTSLTNTLPMCFSTIYTIPSGIQYIIKKIPKNKSPGQDFITNKIIQHITEEAIIFLTNLYNLNLQIILFPWLQETFRYYTCSKARQIPGLFHLNLSASCLLFQKLF